LHVRRGIIPISLTGQEFGLCRGFYPGFKYYGADFMSGDNRIQFLARYEEQKVKNFHNKESLLAYCMDDVSVLRHACCAFINLFFNLVKIDPLDNL